MEQKKQESFGAFQVMILVLSIYVLVALLIDTFFKLPAEVSKVLGTVDNFICVFFLIDFFYRLYKATNKLKFLRWGWIELLASIPTLDIMRAGRLLRVIRLLRILRAFRSTKVLVSHVFQNRTKGTFTAVALISILLVIFSSIAILTVEADLPNGNIKNAEDAIWWAFATITTVGYGDKFPVSTEGRMIASILMIAGVGLFGTFTGFIASWFMEGKKENEVIEDVLTVNSSEN
ncbi:potassium channel family protein [Terrimonas alba]|uniref:potassium channel family protein n=1 Tax=Terrimonas alba TaxID=3349636 RepID=UPI0035F40567